MRKVKKSLILLLILALVFSNVSVVTATSATSEKIDAVELTKEQLNDGNKISKEDIEKETYKASDKVRVIVEVEGNPAIIYATGQGKKFSELSDSKKLELQAQALEEQESIKRDLSSKKIEMDYKESFTTVFNGFSGIVEFQDVEKIKKLSNVKAVTISTEYQRPEVEPNMKYSKELVEARKTWDEYGYDGEGMIVGVIDSGADPNHKDFVLSDDVEEALPKQKTNQLILKNGLPGKYFNEKVPYGYNYMDKNTEIRDLGAGASMHGMHVSGTVVANGDEENGGLKGVAPEAQLLALKVFGNDPNMASTWGDIYIKAIDDAIILGADVLNMSLGSTAGFVDETTPEDQAISNAVENGVLMSISAGNSAHLGNGFFNPYASNPDIGVVGSPGLASDSLQVSSLENSFMDMDSLEYQVGEEAGLFPYMSASSVHPNDIGGSYEIEYVGTGTAEEFGDKDLTGKFALAVRGNTFTDTAFNAMAANAAGVIVYNHSDGWISMASDPEINIPQLFMQKTDGDYLKAQLDAGEEVTISFNGDKVTTANPLADSMSDFTSWGVTPDLELKPEITAPGGNILSTFQDDEYGTMSGTSMAAPHVSGGSALVMQRVDEEFGLEGKDRVEMAKKILMNTAKPIMDKGTVNTSYEKEVPYSPRRQGAGLMQLHKAISTPVVVTESTSGEAKATLKEVGDTISFDLEATNYSDEDVTYDVAVNVQTDFQIFNVLGNAHLTGTLDQLEAADMIADVSINNGEEQITIPAGETAEINVQIDLSDAQVFTVNDEGYIGYYSPEEFFTNGYFVEGFVTLSNESLPELSLPYVGFKGDWNEAPVLDELAYDGNDSFYEQAGMLYDGGDDYYYYLGYDPITDSHSTADIAISPNGDKSHDEIIPLLSFLRNAKTVEYKIKDENGKTLRTIRTEHNIRKNYYDAGLGSMYYLEPSNGWDGTVKDKVVEDGDYIFEISTTIDYEGKEAQTLQVPVIVDTIAPELTATREGNKIVFTTKDDHAGVNYVEIFVDGTSAGMVAPDEKEFTLEDGTTDKNIKVVAIDKAGNETEVKVSGKEDTEIPTISVETPETFGIYDTSEIVVSGTVSDESGIAEFKIEGQNVELMETEEEGLYTFETTIEFEDGDHDLQIYAKDEAGNETSLSNSRLFFVDTTVPGLEVEASGFVEHDTTSVEIAANVSDNFDELRYYIDGSEEYYHEMAGYAMKPINETVTTEVSLQPGNNVFELKVVDLAGNEATEKVEIYRALSADDEAVTRIKGDTRYETAVELSKDGWDSADTVVLARGDNYADALAGVPLAEKYDAPLLLTQPDKYTAVTKEEIDRLGADTVYLLGGEGAINKKVETELKSQGVKVVRLAGDTRDETAVEIANEVVEDGLTDSVVLVNGYNFPDALSVAAYAAKEGLPILLTQDKKLPKATQAALYDLKVSETLAIGGTVAISESVLEKVPNANRVSGANRFETAVEVAKHFDLDTKKYYVTTGMEFPDALSSAARAAKDNTGVLLVGKSVSDELNEFINTENIDILKIVGGSVAISEDIMDQLKKIIK